MTKETQTQAIAEPFKFKNAALLNRLSEMAQVPYYATACHTLIQAEMAIVELERENATLRAEVERLAAQSAPLQQAEPPRPHTTANIEALCKTRAAAQVEPVRMLTEREIYEALVPSINDVPRSSMFDAYKAVQRAFCRVNRGRVIPADGEVRS